MNYKLAAMIYVVLDGVLTLVLFRCHQLLFWICFIYENFRMAEGVGFEPTVGFPTLDFESSALNRTQPPFLEERRKPEPAYAKSFGMASVELR